MTAESSPGRIVRWEVLKGLPGDGQIPRHFHMGHPTPWAEGFVVRFWNQDGSNWVGNFQGACFGFSDITLWPEANAVSIIAGGRFYLIDCENPDSYSTIGPQSVVDDVAFDEHRQMLFVAEGYRVHAFDVQRRKVWSKGTGGYVTKIAGCLGSALTVEIEHEIGEPAGTIEISTEVESVDDRRYLDTLFLVLESHSEVERIDPGLSEAEVWAIQRQFKFSFPPDLRGLLQFKVPVGPRFPDWRGDSEQLEERFNLPFEGILFDVENSKFWLPAWGERPTYAEARSKVVGKPSWRLHVWFRCFPIVSSPMSLTETATQSSRSIRQTSSITAMIWPTIFTGSLGFRCHHGRLERHDPFGFGMML